MRDEDVGCETTSDNPHKICTQTSFNARCAESNSATNASDGVDWAICLVLGFLSLPFGIAGRLLPPFDFMNRLGGGGAAAKVQPEPVGDGPSASGGETGGAGGEAAATTAGKEP